MTLRSGFSDRYVVCSTTEIAFPFVCLSTQLNSTQLTYFALIGRTLQLGQLHCRSPATVELRR